MQKPIVVLGSSNTDMIVKAARIPRPGETVIGGAFSMAAGGKGANQAVAAARAGGQVAFVARVGDDLFGRQARDGFVSDGIDVTHVHGDAANPSGVALIVVDAGGENSITVASGANAELSPKDAAAASELIAGAGVLVMQLETPLATVRAAASIAHKNNVPVILNPAPARALDDELLTHIDVLTPNETETELLTGVTVSDEKDAASAAEVLHSRGVETIIVTLGNRGVYASSEKFSGMIPAFRVEAVDTTAAGDVFNGALAVALVEGRPLEDAVRFASAAAALSVTRLGAQPSAPKRDEIDSFSATAKI